MVTNSLKHILKSLYLYKKSIFPNPFTPLIQSSTPSPTHMVFWLQTYQSSWINIYKYLEIWLTKNHYLENISQRVTADHPGMMGTTG